MEIVYFACGCFWGTQAYFKRLKGVVKTEVGYTGGDFKNPTYEDVCEGITGHYEACKIEFDNSIITFNELLRHFFSVVNPTNKFGQAMDIGSQYMSAIFYTSESQKKLSLEKIDALQKSYNKPITTKVLKFNKFFKAEIYHQDYLDKNPNGYCHIKID